MRLIDADALYKFFLEMHQSGNTCDNQDVLKAITNAPTVQREATPAESLQAHDDEVIEKCAPVTNDWNEKRMDVIGQNGNDGDHY